MTGAIDGHRVLHLVRVTIQALTPLSIGSADNGPGDVVIVRDANGLPMIPGSSLQGRLNHLYRASYGTQDARAYFGQADDEVVADDGTTGPGTSARLCFGFGCVHNSRNVAVSGIVFETGADGNLTDPVLKFLQGIEPLRRDHVKLNGRHVADGRGKFDRSAVPKGTRFSFEISLWGKPDDENNDRQVLGQIMGLMHQRAFRLGGAGARGYGRIECRISAWRSFMFSGDEKHDKTVASELRKCREQVPSVGDNFANLPIKVANDSVTTAKLTLKPILLWRIGGDNLTVPPLTNQTTGIRFADGTADRVGDMGLRPREGSNPGEWMRIQRETEIAWDGNEGKIGKPSEVDPHRPDDKVTPDHLVVPGSAVRGPLLHRMLYHWHVLNDQFLDVENILDAASKQSCDDDEKRVGLEKKRSDLEKSPPAFDSLLGHKKEKRKPSQDEDNSTGAREEGASRLIVNDGTVADITAIVALDHNKIDRFTGGVITGALYSEEAAAGGSISLEIDILPPRDKPYEENVRRAFLRALRDLCRGRLAIGAKSLGFCTGDVMWSGVESDVWKTLWTDELAPARERSVA